MSERTCPGCGLSVVGHANRKWCSEKCRKASYGDPCVDCGTRTAFGAERARVDDPRCLSCGQRKRQADEFRPRWDRMAQLHRDGRSYKEIAAEMGLPSHEIGRYITGLRRLGYELPYRYDEEDGDATCMTVQDFEDRAAGDPDHDWRFEVHGPLGGVVYQRHGEGQWVAVERLDGFA